MEAAGRLRRLNVLAGTSEAPTVESPDAEESVPAFVGEKCPGIFLCVNNANILEI